MSYTFVEIAEIGVMLINVTMPAWGLGGGFLLGTWFLLRFYTAVRDSIR